MTSCRDGVHLYGSVSQISNPRIIILSKRRGFPCDSFLEEGDLFSMLKFHKPIATYEIRSLQFIQLTIFLLKTHIERRRYLSQHMAIHRVAARADRGCVGFEQFPVL
jgi:hypothetical protein